MAEFRITFKFPGTVDDDERDAMLAGLAQDLKQAVDLPQPPRTLMDPDGGTLRPMFLLNVRGAEAVGAALRTLGGWYMHHPDVVLVLKAIGPGGKTAFELTRFSTVAFAQASMKVREALVKADGAGGSP